jgi:hypothetical protein
MACLAVARAISPAGSTELALRFGIFAGKPVGLLLTLTLGRTRRSPTFSRVVSWMLLTLTMSTTGLRPLVFDLDFGAGIGQIEISRVEADRLNGLK